MHCTDQTLFTVCLFLKDTVEKQAVVCSAGGNNTNYTVNSEKIDSENLWGRNCT